MADDTPKLPMGIAMMLKSFGLNPAEITNSIAQFAQIMAALDGKLTAIHGQNTRIIALLEQQNGQSAEQPDAIDNRSERVG